VSSLVRGGRRLYGVRRSAPEEDPLTTERDEAQRLAEEESRRDISAVQKELHRIAASKRRIVCGPWVSEVGFEILYWIPFLRSFQKRYPLTRDRMTVVSRGGVGPWYRGITEEYVELFEHWTPADLRNWSSLRIAEVGSQKQRGLTAPDEQVLQRLGANIQDEYEVLHPSLMYRLFAPVWVRRAPLSVWRRFTAYRPMRLDCRNIHRTDLSALPSEYIAVKLYFSDCLPSTPDIRELLCTLVERLSRKTSVVILSTDFRSDDHLDVHIEGSRNVYNIADMMKPETNLAVQTDVIRNARALISTYGGFSYLAPLLFVPSLSLYSVDNFNPTHLDVMRRTVQKLRGKLGSVDYTVMNIHHLSLFDTIDDSRAAASPR
jgi:hypothetical protein